MVIMVMRNSTGKRGPMTNAIQSTKLIYIYMYTQVCTSIHSIRTLNEMLSIASTQNIMSMDACMYYVRRTMEVPDLVSSVLLYQL